MELCPFRKAMFKSYGWVSGIFFVAPLTAIFLAASEFSPLAFVQLNLSFLVPLFLSGYFFAPYFGARASSKLQSLSMSLICLVIAATVFVVCQSIWYSPEGGFDQPYFTGMTFVLIIILIYGFVPAGFASLFFSGLCEKGEEL